MKPRFLLNKYWLIALIIFLGSLSCTFHRHDVSVSIKESEDVYQMSARFNGRKTSAVERLINEYSATGNVFWPGGNDIDATVSLGGHNQFYVKSSRGRVKIKFDKDENSDEAYYKVKEMCEGIKEMLAEER